MTFVRWAVLALASLQIGLATARAPGEKPKRMYLDNRVRKIAYDVLNAGENTPVVILLPGASGPDTDYYRDRAENLRRDGFTVLVLHYYDASRSRSPTPENYQLWVKAVQDLVTAYKAEPAEAKHKIALVGFSLGASIALAAGSQKVPTKAVVDWWGSLPDEYLARLQGMPPLLILHGALDNNIPVINALQLIKLCSLERFDCESRIYPDQGHGFSGAALLDAESRTSNFLRRNLGH